MRLINDGHTDACFNLAAEEYVFEHFPERCFMLWCNEPAIVVGRHQNALAEVNVEYVRRNGIKVVRRLSGGGAVYHDAGNLNFTFIERQDTGQTVDFSRFSAPIIALLREKGVEAEIGKRDELSVNGAKISGVAKHVSRGRILYHGTLLFSGNLTALTEALRTAPGKFSDKAIPSVRSKVGNISEYLSPPTDVAQFRAAVFAYMLRHLPHAREYSYSEADLTAVRQLRDEKYARWEWNFGQSPPYAMTRSVALDGKTFSASLNVRQGIIRQIRFEGPFPENSLKTLAQLLLNTPHRQDAIRSKLTSSRLTDPFRNNIDAVLEAMNGL
ncbi:MAG: lipoate--protein ligase [Bacteroidales bacterium]|jgi:lipoate-protein ligase A|nr:lipoate--protein ligase [Bacteroidales bacterium]